MRVSTTRRLKYSDLLPVSKERGGRHRLSRSLAGAPPPRAAVQPSRPIVARSAHLGRHSRRAAPCRTAQKRQGGQGLALPAWEGGGCPAACVRALTARGGDGAAGLEEG
jgi:hypothetical protein